MSAPEHGTGADPLADAAAVLIAEHGGDAAAAVAALVTALDKAHRRMEALEACVSWGYVRAVGRKADDNAAGA